ncbi:MAG: hypothetical protein RL172_2985 [Bacteroidota bacterium]
MQQKPALKICIVSPSLKLGGIERALSVLANYFAQQGHTVYFISCLNAGRFYQLHENITIIEPRFKRTAAVVNKFLFYPRLLFFIRKKVRAIAPDVVLSFGDNFNPLVLFALKGTGLPVFISDRTSPDFPFAKAVKWGKQWLYPSSAGFIAQTKRAYEFKKKQFGNRLNMQIIPNALKKINTEAAAPQKIILCVARLSIEKGPDRLLQAFAKMNNRQGWRLVFAGAGPMKLQLMQSAGQLGVAEQTDFLGEVLQVDALFNIASIFVLPSRLEGFPNALCEAMAAGLPVICFDSIPYEEIVTHHVSGLVVPEGDIDKMAEALQLLVDDDALRNNLAHQAKKIAQRLSVDTIGQQYLTFLQSGIKSH